MQFDRERVLALLALASVGVAGCARGEAIEAGSELQTVRATTQSIVSSVEATGTVEPIRIIEVKSQAGGEILELPVETGDRVAPGTLLVRIDDRDVRNAYEQAQADLDVAQAQFDVAEKQLARIEALHESNIVTDEELESATLQYANTKASLVRAETNLELAEDRLNDVTLRAPIAGTIVERSIEVGQVITGTRDLTGGTVLMKMADLNEVQVRMLVDETDIGRLEPGMPAEITVEAYRDRTFRGSVLKIEPQAVVEQNVTMFAVLTRITNEEDLLRPGMNADVEVVVGRQEDVLALPNSGLRTTEEAARIADALGIPGDVNEMAREAMAAAGGSTPTEAATDDEEVINGRRLSELRTMSQNERMQWFQGLSAVDRGRVMQLFQQQGSQGGRAGARSGPRPAFVFEYDPEGNLAMKAIVIGLGNFDFTQVVSGLEDGEEVVSIPMSMIQQQDFINRMRSRTALPGIGGNGR